VVEAGDLACLGVVVVVIEALVLVLWTVRTVVAVEYGVVILVVAGLGYAHILLR
jgi:hypothetical protein